MSEISPAPWKSEGRVVYDANHHLIGCFAIEEGGGDNSKHDKANARLSAAAPELLDAAKEVLQRTVCINSGDDDEQTCYPEICKSDDCPFRKLYKAVAEAEGRETCLKR